MSLADDIIQNSPPAVRGPRVPPRHPDMASRYEPLFRVGRGTPFGDTLRRYWTPACLASDVAEPDCDPHPVRLLGEDLIIFRDSSGRLGCLDEYCSHRTASLLLGRVEQDGIRCLYHGWKFAVDGALLEAPNHPDPVFCQRVRQPAYAVEEAGGLVWVYMGPAHLKPPLPRFPFTVVPEKNRGISASVFDCHFLQALEGGLDTSHLGALHLDFLQQIRPDQAPGRSMAVFTSQFARVDVAGAEHGLDYVAIRSGMGEDGKDLARITACIFPYMVCIAPGGFWGIYAPVDDQTSLSFLVSFSADPNWTAESSAVRPGGGMDTETLREYGMTPDRFSGPDRPGRANNFKQDREAMREGRSFAGLPQILPADYAMVCSMGSFADRSRETLAPIDAPVATLRRLMLESIGRVARGEPPIGLSAIPYMDRIDAAQGSIHPGEDWRGLVPDHVFV
ncbi:MAG: Rieske 2Fe-2S domain-containing protein [Caulobacteraceae bacterium]|nr:Rieske 2Fe-2S domain-containing protein [Caulobacteraceae bacterium]